MEIVPAIEEKTAQQFSLSLSQVVGFAPRIQVDFNDGSFAGYVSASPADISESVAELANKVFFEAHLMVQKPGNYIPELLKAGFKKVIIQYEIEANIREILEDLSGSNVKVGLAIGPATSVFEIEPFADLLDTITVMDIEPGKQGQKFLPAELEKIRELKNGNFPGEVQADGAINLETAPEVIAAGPDSLVAGSYIFKSSDPEASYRSLVELVEASKPL